MMDCGTGVKEKDPVINQLGSTEAIIPTPSAVSSSLVANDSYKGGNTKATFAPNNVTTPSNNIEGKIHLVLELYSVTLYYIILGVYKYIIIYTILWGLELASKSQLLCVINFLCTGLSGGEGI